MVGHPHDKMEWEIPSQEGSGSGNRFRCISDRMGCSVLEYTVGQHPLVTRGVFNDRPPVSRYNSKWNVQAVLTHITSWGETESLSLKQLSWKTAMLLALTCPSRSADLSPINLVGGRYKPNGVVVFPTSLAKLLRQGKPLSEFFFPSFS